MIDIQSVNQCVRGFEYKGYVINYTTGLTAGDVNLRATDIFETMKRNESSKLGYVRDLYDMLNILKQSKAIPAGVFELYDDNYLIELLEYGYLPIDAILKACEHYKMNDLKNKLTEVKRIVTKLGVYVPSDKVKFYDPRHNTDRNISSELRVQALEIGSGVAGMYYDDLYNQIADEVGMAVLGEDIDTFRMNENLLYDTPISEILTPEDYNKMAYMCYVIDYLLRYSDISAPGLGIFARMAYAGADKCGSNVPQGKPLTKRNQKPESTELDYSEYDDYNDDKEVYFQPIKKKHLNSKEVNDFKKNM